MIWKLIFLCFLSTSVLGAPSFNVEDKKDYLMCQVCHIIVKDMQALVTENATEARVEGYLTDICNRLTANNQQCLDFVKNNLVNVFTKIHDGLNPEQICILMKVCPSEEVQGTKNLPQKKKEVVQKLPEPVTDVKISNELDVLAANPIECELCKLVVGLVEQKLPLNKSEAAINATLIEICDKLPGELKMLCTMFEPELLKVLVDDFSPSKACKTIRICSEESDIVKGKSVISCDECKDMLKDLPGEAGIMVCENTAGICGKKKTSHIQQETQNTLDLNVEGLPKGEAECLLCKFVVYEVDNLLGNNKTDAAINASLTKICSSLPAELGGLCILFAPMLMKAIENGLDPNMACSKIGLCSSAPGDEQFEYDLIEHEKRLYGDYEHVVDAPEEPVMIETGPGCAICKLIVQEIDSYIAQNKSAAEINSTVYGLCDKLPAPLNTLCTTYAPIIVKDVIAGFDPSTVCDKVNLCTNGSWAEVQPFNVKIFEEKLKEDLEDTPACTLCKFLVQEIDNYIAQNQSAAAINASVYNLCSKLPAPLSTLCTTYAPIIVKDIVAGFDPKTTCERVKLCTNSSMPMDRETVKEKMQELIENAKDTPACMLCKFLVQEIDNYIGQNQSAAAINASVYNLCSKLPAPLSTLCTTYAPIIVKDIVAGFDPKTTCERVKLCTNSSMIMDRETIREQMQELIENAKDTPACLLCKFLVQEIDNYIAQNQSAAAINASVYNLCSKLPAPLSTLCTTYAPIIVKDIVAGFDPKTTCERVKLCTNSSMPVDNESVRQRMEELVKNTKATPACTLCKFLVQEIDNYIAQNQSAAAINASVYNLCSKLPAPLNTLCTTYAPIIVKDVIAGFDPETTCERVKLCINGTMTNKEEVLRLPAEVDAIKAGPGCAICKLLVQEIDSYIAQNKSAAEINSTVYGLCDKLPAPLNTLCTTYAPIIVKDVMAGFDPEQTCEKVKLCTNGTYVQPYQLETEVEELEETIKADPRCQLCEFVVQVFDDFLQRNKTVAAVNATIVNICNTLPSSLKPECLLFAPQIVNIIVSGVAPENACKAVKLCPQQAVVGEIEGLSCETCHGIVEYFLPRKYTPEYGNKMCIGACPVVRRRRSAESFKQLLTQFDNSAKVHKTWRCDLCEFIIQAVNAYVKNNHSEQTLEDYMTDVCNFMPQPFRDECLKSVPEIIREMSHGFDQDVLCKHVIPDECNGTFSQEIPKVEEYVTQFQLGKTNTECEICKHIIEHIDNNLNHDKSEVELYVNDVCGRLPSPTSHACKSFAAEELEDILIKIIDRLLTPEDVCHMITVC